MTKKLLPALIVMALSATATAEVKVYGKANLSFHAADINDESVNELVSNASRLGFKGSEDLENGLTAIYQFETEIGFDGGSDVFKQRNSFLGVKGNFGTILAGRYDTPLKKAQRKVDLFNDMVGDIKHMITISDNRPNNTIGYQSPKSWGAFAASAQYIENEDAEVDGAFAGHVSFVAGGFYGAVGYADGEVSGGHDASVARLVAQYNIGGLQLGALYEDYSEDALTDEDDVTIGEDISTDGWMASAKYSFEALDLKAQYGASDMKEEGGTSISIGVDYRYSKTFKLLSYYTVNESDLGTDKSYLGVGAELKF